MLLEKQDAELFYDLYFKVLKWYFKLSQTRSSGRDHFNELSLNGIISLRDKLFNNVDHLNLYCSGNPDKLSLPELDIIKKWKYFIRKTFIVYKDLKNYTVFVDIQESASYGVCGLMKEIRDILNNEFPVMVDAFLLSYKDRIVFDGMLIPYDMKISGALNKILINGYRDSKNEKGIITRLTPADQTGRKDGNQILDHFLSENRDGKSNSGEIENPLKLKFQLLKECYDGNIQSDKKLYSILFKSLGLKKGWFAVRDGIIITSGKTEAEVSSKLQDFIPPENVDSVTIFEIDGD